MLQSIKQLCRGKPRTRRPRRFVPRLEALEDRAMPTALTWAPPAGQTDWGTASNWKLSDGSVSSAVPGSGDDVTFSGTAGACTLGGAGICKTLTITGAWQRAITLTSATSKLTVVAGGKLDANTGIAGPDNIKSTNDGAILDLTGGTLDWQNTYCSYTSTNALNVYVEGGATLLFDNP
jgi:hypothetical protein